MALEFVNPDFTKSGKLNANLQAAEDLFRVVQKEVDQHCIETGRFADVYKEIDGKTAVISWCYYH